MEEREGHDVFAGDNAPELRVERPLKRSSHRQRREGEHGQTEPCIERNLVASRQRTQDDKKNQDAEGDPVGVVGEQVGGPKQKNGHRADVEQGWKHQSKMKGAQQEPDAMPKRIVIGIPDQRAAAHSGGQAPSGENSTRIVLARMCRSRRRLQFSM